MGDVYVRVTVNPIAPSAGLSNRIRREAERCVATTPPTVDRARMLGRMFRWLAGSDDGAQAPVEPATFRARTERFWRWFADHAGGLRAGVDSDSDEYEAVADTVDDLDGCLKFAFGPGDGVFSLSGGKLTSHRHMAEETVDRVQSFLTRAGVSAVNKVDTHKIPLPGAGFRDLTALREGIRSRAAVHGLEAATADRLTRAYGSRADRVIDLVQRDPGLGERILDERPHVLAEAVYASREELALHVDDVLFRRTRIGLETRDGVARAAQRVAEVMAQELEWTDDEANREVEQAIAARAPDDDAIRQLTA